MKVTVDHTQDAYTNQRAPTKGAAPRADRRSVPSESDPSGRSDEAWLAPRLDAMVVTMASLLS